LLFSVYDVRSHLFHSVRWCCFHCEMNINIVKEHGGATEAGGIITKLWVVDPNAFARTALKISPYIWIRPTVTVKQRLLVFLKRRFVLFWDYVTSVSGFHIKHDIDYLAVKILHLLRRWSGHIGKLLPYILLITVIPEFTV